MNYIYDRELEKLVERFEKVVSEFNIEYATTFDIQLSKLVIYVGIGNGRQFEVHTHTADFEDIQERLVEILAKVLMEVI